MNPYKVLQLAPGAEKQEVKRAYFKLIRQYTPEKEPEKFKEIREAYEYLQEETNLANVQKVLQLPREFEKPYYQVLEWMKEEEYDQAIALCVRVLSIAELLEFRVLLGRSYILNNNTGKAVKLWEELCRKHKDNLEYLEQLGDSYRMRGWHNKAFQTYYTLYRKEAESLCFYDKFIDTAITDGNPELVCEISERVLKYYSHLEKHTREDAESMSGILCMISDYMSGAEPQWFLNHFEKIFGIMTEIPTEFGIYEDALLYSFCDLIDILEQDETAEPEFPGYRKYILENEKNISARNQNQLMYVKTCLEEIQIRQDPLIPAIIKETSKFWYGLLMAGSAARYETGEDAVFLRQMLENHFDDSAVYDMLLYMVNDLKDILPGLIRVQQEYPELKQAMGKYLEEMTNCTSQEYLFRKYEKKYKRLMGYPSGAKLSLTSDMEENAYDSLENGTYKRDGEKIGRNDPCPCGSGKKYKKCCGK